MKLIVVEHYANMWLPICLIIAQSIVALSLWAQKFFYPLLTVSSFEPTKLYDQVTILVTRLSITDPKWMNAECCSRHVVELRIQVMAVCEISHKGHLKSHILYDSHWAQQADTEQHCWLEYCAGGASDRWGPGCYALCESSGVAPVMR